jgi:3-dehydroquinate dehydratase-2
MKLLVLHGPSLSALGTREPSVYGTQTLADVDAVIRQRARALSVEVDIAQSNHEGVLIDRILAAPADGFAGILLNAAAYAHTSLAIADAVRAIVLPVVEVHLTNTAAREWVRQEALVGAACAGRVEGFGAQGYVLGLEGLVDRLRSAP